MGAAHEYLAQVLDRDSGKHFLFFFYVRNFPENAPSGMVPVVSEPKSRASEREASLTAFLGKRHRLEAS